jgi:hypothetical protein
VNLRRVKASAGQLLKIIISIFVGDGITKVLIEKVQKYLNNLLCLRKVKKLFHFSFFFFLSKVGTPSHFRQQGDGKYVQNSANCGWSLSAGTPLLSFRAGRGNHLVPVFPITGCHTVVVYFDGLEGKSDTATVREYSLQRDIEDLEGLRKGLADQINVLGHSYGGLVAGVMPRCHVKTHHALAKPPS